MSTDNDKDINGEWWVRYPYFKDEFSMDRISDEDWWNNFGRMELNGEQTTLEEVSAFREYLAGRLFVSVAAKSLMALAEERIPVDDEWYKGDRIRTLFHAAALHLPLQQAAILDLVEEIRLLPEPDLTLEQKARLGGIWQEWFALKFFERRCASTTGRSQFNLHDQ